MVRLHRNLVTIGVAVLVVLVGGFSLGRPGQVLSHIDITFSTGTILDGNVVLYQGEDAEFLVETDADCYVFVFLISPDGTVKLSFPNCSQPSNFVYAHRPVRIPESGEHQSVGTKTGWALVVALASDDPSWAYSFEDEQPPPVWDEDQFGSWKGEASTSIANFRYRFSTSASRALPQAQLDALREQLREEMSRAGTSQAASSAEAVRTKAQLSIFGHRFGYAQKRFYVASTAYSDRTYYVEGEDEDFQPCWNVFYQRLYPYGEWVFVSGCCYVWRPYHIVVGWAPFFYGRWVFTDYGWTWVSFEPWGWITYHYGRWIYTWRWGWVWVPGYVWGPAWVEWYWSGTYVAWRPADPPGEIKQALANLIREPPSVVVDRKHLTAERIDEVAKPRPLRQVSQKLVGLGQRPLQKLLDPNPASQKALALKEVQQLKTVSYPPRSPFVGTFYQVRQNHLKIIRPTRLPFSPKLRRKQLLLPRRGVGTLRPAGPAPARPKARPSKRIRAKPRPRKVRPVPVRPAPKPKRQGEEEKPRKAQKE